MQLSTKFWLIRTGTINSSTRLTLFYYLKFKESFFNYLKLGEKVADFSERSSRRFSSAVGAYWKHCLKACVYTRKYKWLGVPFQKISHGRDFFLRHSFLWKYQLSFIHFFKFFWPYSSPHPPGNSNPFCGGSIDIFWNCTFES